MADRTSAEIFGNLFKRLAENPRDLKDLAAAFWGMAQSYDFSNDQMDANAALIKLGLARRVKVGGEMEMEYGPEGE